jgi:hypothetical protein
MKTNTVILFFLSLLIAVMLMTGCDERNQSNYEIASVTVNPDNLLADSISTTYSQVTVLVANEEDEPGAGIAVYFETDIGYMWEKEFTNDEGLIIARFYDDGITGVAHIYTYIEGEYDNGVHKSIDIYPYPSYSIHSLTAAPDEIYADEGVTHSIIEIYVKDQDGISAPEKEVNLSCDLGIITSPVITNSAGYAEAIFSDIGQIGVASITASIGISDSTVNVIVSPTLPVLDVSLELEVSQTTVDEVVQITAEAINQEGLVPDGSVICFSTEMGNFQPGEQDTQNLGNYITLTTSNGIANAWLYTGTIPDNNLIEVESDEQADSAILSITAGEPAIMTLSIVDESGIQTDMIAAGSEESLLIEAAIYDAFGNPASEDTAVFFTSTMGTVENPVYPNINGVAISSFSPGPQVGVAGLTVISGAIQQFNQIHIIASEMDHIFFQDEEPVTVMAGSNVPVIITVNLLDAFDNPVLTPMEVWFKFSDRPEGNIEQGSNLNQSVYNLTDSTSTISANGTASVAVYAGISSGVISIYAWCRPQPYQMVSAVDEAVVVEAGIPYEIQLSIGEINSGVNLGDCTWKIQFSALITDAWNNPVENGTAVYFTLSPVEEYVSINSAMVEVGNENLNGDQTAGTAFSTLVFDGNYTNEIITINADVGNVTESADFALPLQFGEINLLCVPTHIDWHEGNNEEDILYTQCRINVRDGQYNPINNQRIVFTTSIGFPTDEGENGIHPTPADIFNDPQFAYLMDIYDFSSINEELPQDNSDGYTGPYDGALGRLYKDVGFFKYECPPPIPVPPGMAPGSITATIFGTTTSVQQNIVLNRYVD